MNRSKVSSLTWVEACVLWILPISLSVPRTLIYTTSLLPCALIGYKTNKMSTGAKIVAGLILVFLIIVGIKFLSDDTSSNVAGSGIVSEDFGSSDLSEKGEFLRFLKNSPFSLRSELPKSSLTIPEPATFELVSSDKNLIPTIIKKTRIRPATILAPVLILFVL